MRVLAVGDTFVFRGEWDDERPSLGATYGLVTIDALETKRIAGQDVPFFRGHAHASGLEILVPRWLERFRDVATKTEVDAALAVIEGPFQLVAQTWNRRYRDGIRALLQGSILDTARVLRSMIALRNEKSLSYGERKLLHESRVALVEEIAFVTGDTEDAVRSRIDPQA